MHRGSKYIDAHIYSRYITEQTLFSSQFIKISQTQILRNVVGFCFTTLDKAKAFSRRTLVTFQKRTFLRNRKFQSEEVQLYKELHINW